MKNIHLMQKKAIKEVQRNKKGMRHTENKSKTADINPIILITLTE